MRLKVCANKRRKKYFIIFIDDGTRFCFGFFLNSKDEAISIFIAYKIEVENQLNKNIKIIKSDRSGEYESNKFMLCANFGIIYQTTTPYIPQWNC